MRLGLIADIHANLPALEAVLAAMPKVDHVVCAGDFVGYYNEPNKVCERLQALSPIAVRGNHDAYVIGALKPDPSKSLAYRTDWTREQLSPANRAYLEGLPTEQRLDFADKRIVVRHASPWDEETYLYPDSSRLSEISLDENVVLVLGHTHRPMVHRAGKGLIVNPGSVGQPRDWNPQAAFAILDLPSFHVEIRRVTYDVFGLQKELCSRSWDTGAVDILSRSKQVN